MLDVSIMSGGAAMTANLDVARIQALIDARFPQIHADGRLFTIEEASPRYARVRMTIRDRHIRSGGTVSGPSMFTLADFSVYVAIIGALGEAGIDAVTTNLNINFLAKPEPRDLISAVRLIRLGRRLAVGEAQIYSDGVADMVAHAIATYAVPLREA
jgi:uncharacterized protein (TIGR00369 family)